MSGNTIPRRTFLKGTAAGLTATLGTPAILRAQTTTLKFVHWSSKRVGDTMVVPWMEDVARITEGRVQVEMVPPPGPPPALWDMVRDGSVDIAYSLHGYAGDTGFLRARIGQFSFLGDAYSVSQAFSKVYGKLLNAEEEHPGVELLGLFQHGPGQLMLRNKDVQSIDDYKGLKIRVSGGYNAALMADLGCEPVQTSPTDVKAAFQEGRIDGACFPISGAYIFDILDQVTNVVEMPGGYYNATFWLAMSERAASTISPEDLELIRTYSLQTTPVLAAKAFDYDDYLEIVRFEEIGIPIVMADDTHVAAVKERAQRYEQEWSALVADEGYDGEKAIAHTRRLTGGNG